MGKEALFWKKLNDNNVQCQLCPRNCIIKERKRGNCGVRENQKGKLYSLVYSRPASVALDPIEKKPLYHFFPSEETLSFGTVGCNLHCLYCQNFEISQCKPENIKVEEVKPTQIIEKCRSVKSKIISYTYTEPIIFYEYMLDTAELAKRNFLKNVIVSNGFINPEPLKKLVPFLDAANIDFKGNDRFYREITGAWLEPVLKTLEELKRKKVWLEITNLIVPTLNDSEKDIKWIVDWIADNLDSDVPLHFSAFWPTYKLQHLPSTSLKTLRKAREIGMKKLNYVYTGNLPDSEGNNTYCPRCKKAVIKRNGFWVTENLLKDGRCPCGEKIAGVWK
ncbi:MAG: AmmeMemoRadiSam system radical SAM enzyme [Candidatus Pacearchaeota archaeon]